MNAHTIHANSPFIRARGKNCIPNGNDVLEYTQGILLHCFGSQAIIMNKDNSSTRLLILFTPSAPLLGNPIL